jgi:hypothetical protein
MSERRMRTSGPRGPIGSIHARRFSPLPPAHHRVCQRPKGPDDQVRDPPRVLIQTASTRHAHHGNGPGDQCSDPQASTQDAPTAQIHAVSIPR